MSTFISRVPLILISEKRACKFSSENAHDRASTRFTPPPFSSSSINISSCSQTTRRTGSSMKEPVEVSPISRRPTSAFTVTALPPPQPQPPSVHGHEASEVPISLLPGCPCPGCWPSSYTNAVSLSLLNSSSNVEAPVVHNRTEPSTGITAFTYPSEPEWTPPGTCEMNKAVRDPLDAIETAGVPSSHSISDQEYHNEIVYTPCGPSTFSPSSFVDSQCTPQQWFPPSPLTPSPDPSYPVIFPPGMPATDSTYSQEALQGQWTPSLHWNTDATVSRIRPNDTDSYNAFYVQWPDYNPGIEPFPLRPLNGVPFSIPSDINPSSGWLLLNDRRNDQVLVGPYKDKTVSDWPWLCSLRPIQTNVGWEGGLMLVDRPLATDLLIGRRVTESPLRMCLLRFHCTDLVNPILFYRKSDGILVLAWHRVLSIRTIMSRERILAAMCLTAPPHESIGKQRWSAPWSGYPNEFLITFIDSPISTLPSQYRTLPIPL